MVFYLVSLHFSTNIALGTPFDDVIVIGDDKNCVVKNDRGNNKYIIHLSNERNFIHIIIDDSATLGKMYLVNKLKEDMET